jgi:type I restriction enzyme, R subunit
VELEVREPTPHYGSGPVIDSRTAKAIDVDEAIRSVKKAGWLGNKFKEREVRNAIKSQLDGEELVDRIFEIVKSQREY